MGNTSVKPHPRSKHKKQVHWKAADRPTPPGKPQLVSESEITPDVVTIRWDPPRYDGGSPITGYLVEHRRYGSPHWVRATPLLVPFTELSLSGLEPGWRYQFRVSAENAVGLSTPGELSELLTVTLQRSAVTIPRFIDELEDSIALENEKVEFIAQFLGQPVPKICWFKDGFEIFSSRRIRITTENDRSILTIHQSSLSDEGEIKCTATNRAGHASTRAKLTLEAPPSIRLPRQYEDGLLFELGEVMRLKVAIAGRPTPLVFWTHNNESIKSDDRYEIENNDKNSTVRIEEATRTDRGEYQVKAVNKLGEAIASFLVTVTDKPSPPQKARVIMTLGRSVTLSWSVPTDDGGCKIGNYIVEYFRIGWDVWLKAATCRQLTTTIGELIEGSEYKFRVKAESPYGVSDPSSESDVVFIPDPKRGILTPSPRSRSNPRDVFPNDIHHSTRAETLPRRPQTPVNFYEGGIPVRPVRTKIKSPSITPEVSPIPNRRPSNKNIFDRASMARDLAYGTPEISYDSEKLNQSPNLVVKSTVNVIHLQTPERRPSSPIKYNTPSPPPPKYLYEDIPRIEKSPSPIKKRSLSPAPQMKTEKPPNPFYFDDRLRNKSPSPRPVSRSPSPSPKISMQHEAVNLKYDINLPKSPRSKNAHLANSSEFMLVLLPENERGRAGSSDMKFDFDDNSVPPPISLSAPELGAEPIVFEPLRMSVSSSELLHEQAMARFYEAIEAEENRLNREEEMYSVNGSELPKIQINSTDDQIIVGLERKNSLRRRLSGGGLTVPQQLHWAQRRHSLKNTPELNEFPENNLRKFPERLDNKNVADLSTDEKRQLFSTRQRSESEEKEEEEFERVRAKMGDKKGERKLVGVLEEEDWDEVAMQGQEYEESLSESETDSSEDERLRNEMPPIYVPKQEETYHPRLMTKKLQSDEPFEILTKPNPLPDPNFIPKPILKRRDVDDIPEKPIRKNLNTNNASQSAISVNRNATNIKEARKAAENSTPSFSLFPQNRSPKVSRKVPAMRKRGRSPAVPNRSDIAEAANVVVPQSTKLAAAAPVMQRKKSDEEIKCAVAHYGDIVKSYGQKGRSIPRVYLNAADLKAAAERESEEDLREIDKSVENLAKNEDLSEDSIRGVDLPTDNNNRRRSFVLEASSALLRTVKEKVSAVLAGDQEDDIIPPEAEIIPPVQRRGSAQLKRRSSKSPNKSEMKSAAKKSSPSASESNWSNLRAPSPGPQGRKPSPSPLRRNSFTLVTPTSAQSRRTSISSAIPKPKMRETMTQTFGSEIRLAARHELTAKAEIKVRTTVDYITDLAMFIVACWLYFFQNELLAIPVLLVMVYRQLKEEIKNQLPAWMVGDTKVKRK